MLIKCKNLKNLPRKPRSKCLHYGHQSSGASIVRAGGHLVRHQSHTPPKTGFGILNSRNNMNKKAVFRFLFIAIRRCTVFPERKEHLCRTLGAHTGKDGNSVSNRPLCYLDYIF
jgi:hypothetical protein